MTVFVRLLAIVLVLAAAPAIGAEAITLLDLTADAPPKWQRVAPGSSFRLAQFVIERGSESAEATVFHFGGREGGGSAEANIERWTSQFSAPDGGPVVPDVRRYTVPAGPATSALLQGTYARGIGGGPQGPAKPGQALYAVVVDTREARLIFQLWGPRAIVQAERAAMDAMIASLKAR